MLANVVLIFQIIHTMENRFTQKSAVFCSPRSSKAAQLPKGVVLGHKTKAVMLCGTTEFTLCVDSGCLPATRTSDYRTPALTFLLENQTMGQASQ